MMSSSSSFSNSASTSDWMESSFIGAGNNLKSLNQIRTTYPDMSSIPSPMTPGSTSTSGSTSPSSKSKSGRSRSAKPSIEFESPLPAIRPMQATVSMDNPHLSAALDRLAHNVGKLTQARPIRPVTNRQGLGLDHSKRIEVEDEEDDRWVRAMQMAAQHRSGARNSTREDAEEEVGEDMEDNPLMVLLESLREAE
ncbi:hypothetical protein BT69DRAFT_1281379 [Atractiella rhizophila]|nr:hypothetical protein BT69DRAFT_1281379 [Atractiella rhizophila]